MTPIQLNVSAAVQAVIISVAILSIAIIYFDKISSISKDISKMAGSVNEIEGEVSSVELHEMEQTLTKTFTKIDYIVDQQSVHKNGQQSMPTGSGTVYTKLEQTEIEVGISYVTTHPESKAQYHNLESDEIDNIDYDGPEIVIEVEFDEEINMQGLLDKLSADEDVVDLELEYIGREIGAKPTSPFELVFHIPTGDFETVSEFMPEYLCVVDKNISELRDEKSEIETMMETQFK